MKRLALVALCLTVGCGGLDGPPGGDSAPPPSPSAPGLMAPQQMPDELIEPSGMRWRKTRLVTPVDDEATDQEAAAPGTAHGPDMTTMPMEDLARALRPIMLFNGVEYEASWGDAMRIAASARAAYARKPTPPAGDDAAIIRQPVVVNDVDQRIDISAQAATNPYLNVALLERPYHPKGNRAVTLTALCTCFKVDQFTCVTAAHCLANNWVKESGRTWRTQSTIQFGAGAPLGPPLPELKPKDTPYSIVIPAGYWTDGAPVEYLSRFDIAVIRFSGPLMSSSVGGEYAPVSGPPLFVNPTVPKQFYDTGSSGFFDMTELLLSANQTVAVVGYPEDSVPRLMYDNGPLRPPSGDGRLLYRVDTNPGESGGPVLWVDEQNRLRVVGVHRGPGPFGWNLGVELTGGLIDWINEVHGYEVR